MKHAIPLALILIGLYAAWRPEATAPDVTPDTPDAATQAIVEPVTAALAGHGEQARELAGFYSAAADCVRRDGAGAKVITTNSQLRTFLERAVRLRFQGAFASISGLSDAIHGQGGALARMLGLEAAQLDHAAAARALDAVAWACKEAG